MRIAVYNRWLLTRGGGERHSLALAATLAQRHEVTVITHRPADLHSIGTFLELDLRTLKLAVLPDSPTGRTVTAASTEYDVFFGASHTDIVLPRARHNCLLVFFPPRLPSNLAAEVLLEGWYMPEQGEHGPFRWSDAEATLLFKPSSQARIVDLLLAAPLQGTRLRVVCEGDRGSHRLTTTAQWFAVRLPAGASRIDLGIQPPYVPPNDPRQLGVALYAVRSRASGWRRAWNWTLSADQLQSQPVLSPAVLSHYQLVLANSHFTQSWIERRWQLTSYLLYPPVTFHMPAGIDKQPLVISVGRFFPGGHAKNHALLITAFQRLYAMGIDDWRLVLVGGLDTAEVSHRHYFESLQAQVGTAPIILAPNLSADELQSLYAQASLYWHASGYGIDVDQQPELVEHFGITVAQAQAAGAVPLVYGVGGPAEIVSDGLDGRHWQTVDELVNRTRELINDPAQHSRLALQGRLKTLTFSPAAFEQRVWELWNQLFLA